MEVLSRMLEAMVVTLREGVEMALVVGIVLSYLKKSENGYLSRYVYRGLWAAIIASVLGAIAVQRLGLDSDNPLLEGSFMLAAALLVGSLIVWMWRTGKTLKQRMENRLEATASGGSGKALFLFTFFMVLREGIETVLFLSALSTTIGANAMYNALGGGLGLSLAFVFGFFLIKGSVRVNLKRFFTVTSLVLILLVFKLIANGLHEFFEADLISSTPALLSLVGFLTRESTSVLILIALIALPGLAMLQESWGSPPQMDPALSPPERRMVKAQARRSRIYATATAGVALAISYLLGISLVVSASRGYDPPPVAVAGTGPIRIPLAEIAGRAMAKYTAQVNGVDVRFFVARSPEGKIAVAFDACHICPLKGYFLNGGQMICHNCGAPIAFDTIGVPGGCNPMPLEATITKDEVMISREALARGAEHFAHGNG